MIKFSIIVPIYNVELYIKECVDSIINQNYKNLEIILVDDGSKDNSGDICDEYAKKDKRIKVIHSENKGLSAARNIGLKYCSGDYILFIDGDDFIERNCISDIAKIVIENNDVDIIFGKIIKYYKNKNLKEEFILNEKKILGKESIEILTYFLNEINENIWSACRSIYKNDFLKINNFKFREGITSEDLDAIIELYMKAKKISVYDTPFYYYRQLRPNSIINTININRFKDIVDIIKKYLYIIENEKYPVQFKNALLSRLSNVYASYILIIGNVPKKDRFDVINIMNELIWILKYSTNNRGKYVYWGEKLLGLRITYSVYFYLKKIFYKLKELIY